MPTKKAPTILIIMDGWGVRKQKRANAVALANLPNFRSYLANYPNSVLKAHGTDVGLPEGYQGNSEVGHLNIGAGRVVKQQITIINESIVSGEFFKKKSLLKAVENCKKHDSSLHLMGLVQREGVHAMSDHLIALLRLSKMNNLKKVYVHVFTDGRDTPPKSALSHVAFVQKAMKELKTGSFATVTGRYYAMDRDNRWERIQLAYEGIVNAKGEKAMSVAEAIKSAYSKGQTDEFIKPIILSGYDGIKANDSVIFFNYRLDRARQLTRAFVDDKFDLFARKKLKINYVCMTPYYKDVPAGVVFDIHKLKNILGEVVSKKGKRQLRIAETEKYAHVTFFFNGEIEQPFSGEDRILVPSPKVATYDLQPEMNADIVRQKALEELAKKKHPLIILNFANPDMVGHTGMLPAIIKAVETVDRCMGEIVSEILKQHGTALIIADHGNCEQKEGKYKTSHTKNDVPCILVRNDVKGVKLNDGKLADVAPTLLDILGIKKPKEMTGKSLIK
jgi:2,3-bisphosphoglycerate-independent phosphoglycerate mutase